jgi:hypothetical protein
MPRARIDQHLAFVEDITRGLDEGTSVPMKRQAALKTCAAAVTEERMKDFTHVAGPRYVFTPLTAEKLGDYPWDTGGKWQMLAAPDGGKLLVREDKLNELKQSGMLDAAEFGTEPPSHLAKLVEHTAFQAEPPNHVVPPAVVVDKLRRLNDKEDDRELSMNEKELQTNLEDAAEHKGLDGLFD